MPTLSIKHITTYQYRKPVAFGEHRMMLRPRNGYDQSLIDAKLVITPTPISIRRTQDAFGNHLDIARFADRAMELRFESTIRLDHSHADIHDQDIEESARTYPFSYGAEEMPDLVHLIERKSFDPDCQVERWARTFLQKDRPTNTSELLIDLTRTPLQTSWELGKRVFEEARRADALYFPGAPQPCVDIIEPLEKELGTFVISSLQASLWKALQIIKYQVPVEGYGRLLRDLV
jgi:Bacterial transglutaminase-like N-terminal region/Arylmalonate decarboxylase